MTIDEVKAATDVLLPEHGQVYAMVDHPEFRHQMWEVLYVVNARVFFKIIKGHTRMEARRRSTPLLQWWNDVRDKRLTLM